MLEGKVLLVTGGTGAIGTATCLAAARYGATVAFTYRSQEAAAASLAEQIEAAGGRQMHARVDGRVATEVDDFVQRVEGAYERIDVLINNVGAIQAMPLSTAVRKLSSLQLQ